MALATLDLFGPVRLTDACGADCTPRLAKVRAILVVLSRAPEGRMSRAALREMIWQDRAPEQQQASLRQALSALRASLGEARDLLHADAVTVSLDLSRLSVRHPPEEMPDQFATDLDLHEPAFQDWIAGQRQQTDEDAQEIRTDMAVVAMSGHGSPLCELVGQTAVRRAAGVLPLRGAVPDERFDFFLELFPMQADSLGGFRITDGYDHVLAADTFPLTVCPSDAADSVARALLKIPALGLNDVLSFDATRLARAEARLEGQGGAAALTLRAFLRNTRIVERLASDPAEELAEARALSLDALDLDPENPFTLAVAAHVGVRHNRVAPAVDMAKRAVGVAPRSAFAHVALSTVAAATGRTRAAAESARHARQLSAVTLTPAFGAMAQAAASAAKGDALRARDHALAASDLARGFRPPLRYLAVLEDVLGNEKAAHATLAELKRLEPGVCAKQLRAANYPLASLRRGGLLAS